jgi:TusA-related sulfurtransferase
MKFEYDGCADKCPLPLVKTRVILKKMQPKDSCLIKVCDKGSMKNIINYLTKYQHQWHVNATMLDESILSIEITAKEES